MTVDDDGTVRVVPTGAVGDAEVVVLDAAEVSKLKPTPEAVAVVAKYGSDIKTLAQSKLDAEHPDGPGAVVAEVSLAIDDKGELSYGVTLKDPEA